MSFLSITPPWHMMAALHVINIIFATVLEHPDINNSQNNYAA